jgi:hypothetical protein
VFTVEDGMPRFWFQIYDADGEPRLEREGLELSDLDAARGEAIRRLRDMACATGVEADEPRYFAVDVVDELGNTLVRARLSETVETIGFAIGPALHAARLSDALPAALPDIRTSH